MTINGHPIAAARQYSKSVAAFLLVVIVVSVLTSAGCGPRRTPQLARIFAEVRAVTGKRPLVIIPGILGSQLVNTKTGEIAWPSFFRSSGNELSLPISPDLAANKDDLQPQKIIDSLKLSRLVPEVFVYHQLLQALHEYGGYTEGDWNSPAQDGDHDKFYVFAYDWRRDNVENARELVRRMAELKRRLGKSALRFNILAHSMGGLIARYAAEYGDSDLPPDDVSPTPTWAGAAHINRILMFGTPNEGSADAFATLLDGYSITEGLRARVRLLNKLGREVALTVPSLFQLMPHSGAVKFLDGNLEPVQVDLYDATFWRKYGWSAANDPDYRRRFSNGIADSNEERPQSDSLKNLDAYLAAVLHRAKRFHEALDAPSDGEQPVILLVFGGDCEETLNAPVLLRDEKRNRWTTLIGAKSFRSLSGRKFSTKEVTASMYLPGDGRVTRRSLLAETLVSQNSDSSFVRAGLPFAYAVFACDLHGELQNNKTLQDNALTALVAEAVK